jgi:hypothetical protein
VALTHTGLSAQAAAFQARSAFTGVGYTTNEAESVVQHPVRRRIAMLLMLLGNAGMVSAISSLILSFVNPADQAFTSLERLGIILGGIAVLFLLTTSPLLDRASSRVIGWALERWTHVDTRDYANLLHLSGEYRVKQMAVKQDDWLAHKALNETDLTDEGIIVLGIERSDGRYLGAPVPETEIEPGDELILYGRHPALRQLDERKAGVRGEAEHHQAVSEQQEVVERQQAGERIAAKQKSGRSGEE